MALGNSNPKTQWDFSKNALIETVKLMKINKNFFVSKKKNKSYEGKLVPSKKCSLQPSLPVVPGGSGSNGEPEERPRFRN